MKISLLLFLSIFFFVSCIHNSERKTISNNMGDHINDVGKNPLSIEPFIRRDTSLNYMFRGEFNCKVEIVLPAGNIKGNILLLHGWNLPPTAWCEQTDFCQMAIEAGYALIIPELDKCNYPLEIYPETLRQYKMYPTLPWIIDTLLVGIATETGLLVSGQINFVAGISTGGRGATLLAFYKPELFSACASLSGDFNITAMQNEYLYIAWFGPYKDFPKRWERECFAYRCEDYDVPTYIGHGKQDDISPYTQSKAMYDSIKINHPDLFLIGHFPDSVAHNYKYWASESRAILDFFNECNNK
jgi:pimeloyl-ACP methyl ester carboxylesterase